MESHKINQYPLPPSGSDSYISALNSIFDGRKGYETSGDEENCIMRTREIFSAAVKKHKAPLPVPIVLRNHSERGTFLGLEHVRRKVDSKYPPEETFVIFTFADDIYANLSIIFSKDYPAGKQKPYLLHERPARIVCLSQQYSPEDAFEESLSLNPQISSDDINVVKQSPYVDPAVSKLKSFKGKDVLGLRQGCMAQYSRVDDNEIQFTVDFSVIYPENIWSTAYVVCFDCGKLVETAFCDAVKEAAKSEIWHNIVQYDIQKEISERERYVIRLPMTNSRHTSCSFREGLIGFTPLTRGADKPSLYVRVRITFYTNELSRFGSVIHNHKWG